MDSSKINIPQSNVSPEVKARMWQFFLKTSVPRLIAKYEREKAEKKEVEDAEIKR